MAPIATVDVPPPAEQMEVKSMADPMAVELPPPQQDVSMAVELLPQQDAPMAEDKGVEVESAPAVQPPPPAPVVASEAVKPAFDPARPLAGKVALITGAGRGIGKGIALELGKRGASIVVNYGSSAKAAEDVVHEIEASGSSAVALQADISKPAEVADLFDRAIAHYGKVDIVVSNSGTEVWCPEVEVTPELFDRIFNLNCRGQFFVAQQGLKWCQPGGRIILTSSVAATLSGIPNHALYAGSKAAVEGFTRAFAVDCGHKGITVNAIAPGGVKTDMYDENSWHYVPGGYKGMPMEIIDQGLARLCPLNRVGIPADIGKAVYALCSEEGEWINGQVIKLTGGSAT